MWNFHKILTGNGLILPRYLHYIARWENANYKDLFPNTSRWTRWMKIYLQNRQIVFFANFISSLIKCMLYWQLFIQNRIYAARSPQWLSMAILISFANLVKLCCLNERNLLVPSTAWNASIGQLNIFGKD